MANWNSAVMRARRPAQTSMYPTYGSAGAITTAEDQMIGREGQYGEQATGDYLDRAENFDASAALNKYAQGAWGSIQTALGDTLKQQTGAAVGAGRFDSGYFDEDKGTVINRATQQFSNDLASQSMNAVNADQRNTESLGTFGTERSGRAADLLVSRGEQVMNDQRAADERRRRSQSGIAGAIGGALGAGVGFFSGGGPAGAMAGWNIGSGIGSSFGG